MNRKERRIAEAQGKTVHLPTNLVLAEALNKALTLQQSGNLQPATLLCQQVLVAEPQNVTVLALLGTLYLQQGNSEECIKVLDRAIALNNRNATAYIHRGVAHFNLKAYDKALADYDKAIALSPDSADIYNNRGFTLFTLKQYYAANASYDKALILKPHYYEALVNKGDALCALERHSEGVGVYDKAIAVHPQSIPAYNNRANALAKMGLYQKALASCDQAIALNANIADLHNTRAAILKSMERLEDCVVSADKALALNPHFEDAWITRGGAMSRLGKNNIAIANYDKALAINPIRLETLWNKSFASLLLGDYEQGWKLYETRFEVLEGMKRIFVKPKWRGIEPLAGKTILLYQEQGLGDSLQFCRYIPMVEALGANVIVEAQPAVMNILATLDTNALIVRQGDALPDFDCHCPFMSLPLAFKTTVDTIPAKIPYLHADIHKCQMWQEKLGPKIKPRIGLVWSGGTIYKNDRNRSMTLETFLPLLECDAEFHCLQKEVRAGDAEMLAQSKIISHCDELKDFTDTASLIMEIDLVISVDSSVAHVANAMGKPAWVLLPFAPDFRWLLDREDSPWYPTARLFRQKSIGDWKSVIERVKAEIQLGSN